MLKATPVTRQAKNCADQAKRCSDADQAKHLQGLTQPAWILSECAQLDAFEMCGGQCCNGFIVRFTEEELAPAEPSQTEAEGGAAPEYGDQLMVEVPPPPHYVQMLAPDEQETMEGVQGPPSELPQTDAPAPMEGLQLPEAAISTAPVVRATRRRASFTPQMLMLPDWMSATMKQMLKLTSDASLQEIELRTAADAQLQETDAQLPDSDAQLQEIGAQLPDSDAQLQETDAQPQETDAQLPYSDAQLQETDKYSCYKAPCHPKSKSMVWLCMMFSYKLQMLSYLHPKSKSMVWLCMMFSYKLQMLSYLHPKSKTMVWLCMMFSYKLQMLSYLHPKSKTMVLASYVQLQATDAQLPAPEEQDHGMAMHDVQLQATDAQLPAADEQDHGMATHEVQLPPLPMASEAQPSSNDGPMTFAQAKQLLLLQQLLQNALKHTSQPLTSLPPTLPPNPMHLNMCAHSGTSAGSSSLPPIPQMPGANSGHQATPGDATTHALGNFFLSMPKAGDLPSMPPSTEQSLGQAGQPGASLELPTMPTQPTMFPEQSLQQLLDLPMDQPGDHQLLGGDSMGGHHHLQLPWLQPPLSASKKRSREFSCIKERNKGGLWCGRVIVTAADCKKFPDVAQGQTQLCTSGFLTPAEAAKAVDSLLYLLGRLDKLNFPISKDECCALDALGLGGLMAIFRDANKRTNHSYYGRCRVEQEGCKWHGKVHLTPDERGTFTSVLAPQQKHLITNYYDYEAEAAKASDKLLYTLGRSDKLNLAMEDDEKATLGAMGLGRVLAELSQCSNAKAKARGHGNTDSRRSHVWGGYQGVSGLTKQKMVGRLGNILAFDDAKRSTRRVHVNFPNEGTDLIPSKTLLIKLFGTDDPEKVIATRLASPQLRMTKRKRVRPRKTPTGKGSSIAAGSSELTPTPGGTNKARKKVRKSAAPTPPLPHLMHPILSPIECGMNSLAQLVERPGGDGTGGTGHQYNTLGMPQASQPVDSMKQHIALLVAAVNNSKPGGAVPNGLPGLPSLPGLIPAPPVSEGMDGQAGDESQAGETKDQGGASEERVEAAELLTRSGTTPASTEAQKGDLPPDSNASLLEQLTWGLPMDNATNHLTGQPSGCQAGEQPGSSSLLGQLTQGLRDEVSAGGEPAQSGGAADAAPEGEGGGGLAIAPLNLPTSMDPSGSAGPEEGQNSLPASNATRVYPGVVRDSGGRWHGRTYIAATEHNLLPENLQTMFALNTNTFDTAAEAAKALDRLFYTLGRHDRLNFPMAAEECVELDQLGVGGVVAAFRREGSSRPSIRKRVSVYRGVTQCPSTSKKIWKGLITYKRRTVGLGSYDTEEEAARAYDGAARLLGYLDKLNFPEEVVPVDEELMGKLRSKLAGLDVPDINMAP
eukprot:gene31151-6293_t